jgi:hypothetical protein
VDIHGSALRHGISESDINHALDNAVVVIDLESDADPPKILAIGPDMSTNLLEVILLDLEDGLLVIHAMPLRPKFHDLLR